MYRTLLGGVLAKVNTVSKLVLVQLLAENLQYILNISYIDVFEQDCSNPSACTNLTIF